MLDILLYVTLGLALTLLCRKPGRRLFGAGPAFTLWALPPLFAVLPYLPAMPPAWMVVPTTLVLPAARALITQAAPAASATHWSMLVWLAGVLLCSLRLVFHYARVMRQIGPVPAVISQALQADWVDVDLRRLRLHQDGPAVLWAPRSLLLLPPDFLQRFNAVERQLVLRHEQAHLRRGDTWWSLLAELALALLWFHPLAWLAMPRFRLDQELACDERVLRQSPQDERIYANTLLHSIGMDAEPVLIPWLAEPQLKERLTMIQRLRPGALRRRVGFIGLAVLMVGSAVITHASTNTRSNQPVRQDLSYNDSISPQYPADAIKHHEQGTVVLLVLIGADGKPRKFSVDPASQASPDLVKAASDAVMQWRFNPMIKNGVPVEAYAKVPVKFSIPDKPAKALNALPPLSPTVRGHEA